MKKERTRTQKEVERLDKVKERKTVTMGGGNWK